jgi:DNA/RNA endonuclease G (NUC1)
MTDFTTIHPLSAGMAHHLDLHLWRGAPKNLNQARPVQMLINQGYVVGFCPSTLQPAWSAYCVAHADQAVDYLRPLHYYSDVRIDPEYRLTSRTFGKIGSIPLNVGHMTPNEVINRQYGRLAQMETFLMSNMSPQYEVLNQGVWAKLEQSIREVQTIKGGDYAWVIVGPIFGDEPPHVSRDGGKLVPVPESYFAIIVDPVRYPYDTPASVKLDCFIIPQSAPRASIPSDYPSTLEEIEERTGLRFFDSWARTYTLGQQLENGTPLLESRLQRAFLRLNEVWKRNYLPVPTAQPVAESIDELIETLKAEAEASSDQVRQEARQSTAEEKARAAMLQHTMSWLLRAREVATATKSIANSPSKSPTITKAPHDEIANKTSGSDSLTAAASSNIITYKIINDIGDRLKNGARAACNFWNRYLVPDHSIVIRLGVFTQLGGTIARAYMPYEKDGVHYGQVEFNTRFLLDFTADNIAGTIIHEIGHTLGIGWEKWRELFEHSTGRFKPSAIAILKALSNMEVERDGGEGTALAHWDEELFDRELMTGYKEPGGEHVLPVTIDLMATFGHTVTERLEVQTSLEELLQGIASMVFSRQDIIRSIDLDHFVQTPLRETVPHQT